MRIIHFGTPTLSDRHDPAISPERQPSGPRHVAEIIEEIMWKLLVSHEAERMKVQT